MNNAFDNAQTDKEMTQKRRLHEHLLVEMENWETSEHEVRAYVGDFMYAEQDAQNPYIDDPEDAFEDSIRVMEIMFEGIIQDLHTVVEKSKERVARL